MENDLKESLEMLALSVAHDLIWFSEPKTAKGQHLKKLALQKMNCMKQNQINSQQEFHKLREVIDFMDDIDIISLATSDELE